MLFDRYIMIDWSSTNGFSRMAPTKDAVWMAVAGASGEIKESYFRGRAACIDAALQELTRSSGQRVLVGFDFPYGYPCGFASALGLAGVPWRATWDELKSRIEDDDENRNNRFKVAAKLNEILTRPETPYGPFWGRPAKPALDELPEGRRYDVPFLTKSGAQLAERRLTEQALPRSQSAWKLYTAGSVGGQALVGIPCVARLRDVLAARSKVWPFETGFTDDPLGGASTVLHAEIWPGVIDGDFPLLAESRQRDRLKKKKKRLQRQEENLSPADNQRLAELDGKLGPLVTDQLQVRCMCEWARTEDARGTLGKRFAAPPGLTESQLATCVTEEGWVLGAH